MIIVSIDLGATYSKVVMSKNGKITLMKSYPSESDGRGIDTVKDWISEFDEQIDKIVMTGGRSKFFPKELEFNGKVIPVNIIPEMEAIGRSCGQGKKIVISVGTGTAIVKLDEGYAHMGGTGLGGGTVFGLGTLLTQCKSFEELEKLAGKGTRAGVDLAVGDILGTGLGELSKKATASNFGKGARDIVSIEDRALGCFTLVAETIAILASQVIDQTGINELWLTGKLATSVVFQNAMENACEEINIGFNVHKNSEFATALGALEADTIL